ncbi:hypothetical protein BD779DRAFT_406751 [Infundibulicybe gibba]|nr:hypothetical protein BD779DRAFT_406751 [Infundibulicybe gibba]
MTLQPSLRPLIIAGSHNAPHTLDVFLDYVCPFSAKIALVMDQVLAPLFNAGGKYAGKVRLIVRPQVQPWHSASPSRTKPRLPSRAYPRSTFGHSASLYVSFLPTSPLTPSPPQLFKHQEAFFDIPTSTQTPLQIRKSLAVLAGQVLPPACVSEFGALLELRGSPNGGVAVTDDLKYTVKYSRQNGIHVSPTVMWDGLVASAVSSSWGEVEWSKFLQAQVVV